MKSLLACASTAAMVLASPSLALTPAEFLEDFKAFYAAQGMMMEVGSTSTDGDAEVLTDVGFRLDADDGTVTTISIDEMRFEPTSEDGYEVKVTHSPEIRATSSSSFEDETIEVNFALIMDGGYLARADGDKRILLLDYSDTSLSGFSMSGVDDTPEMDITFVMKDIAGTAEFSLSAKEQAFDYGAASLAFSMDVESPEGPVNIEGNYSDLAFTGTAGIFDSSDPEALFKADAALDAVMGSSSSSFTAKGNGPDGAFDFALTGGESKVLAKIDGGQLDYSFLGDDLELNFTGDMLPIPVAATMAGYETRLAMPMVPTDAPGEMAIRFNLSDLSVDDAIWGMIDPAQALPRDPANLMLDVVSKASALYSLLDQDAMEEAMMQGGMPFEFENLELRELRVSLAGAEVSGKGSAVINNAGPFPMPVGGVDVEILGVNGLMGKLTEMGLLQPQQAMPVQMMMGMFAKPGTEPDSFTSRVEMGEDGSITANGIPLQ